MTTNEPKRAVLAITSPSGETQIVKLRNEATIFGRSKGDIIIPDKEISSTHCQIQIVKGDYHLFDMNSTNGTFLNNERVIKCKLSNEDVVTIGQTMFVFKLVTEKESKSISTVFETKSKQGDNSGKLSVVDTLIESAAFTQNLPDIKLDVIYPDQSSDTLMFNQDVIFIGRASSFGRFDSDSEISRKHLKIKLNSNKELLIEDQGSTNGVILNGQKIQGIHKISSSDMIQIGDCFLKVSLVS